MAGGAGGSLGGAFSAGRGSVCIPGLGVKGGRGEPAGAAARPRRARVAQAAASRQGGCSPQPLALCSPSGTRSALSSSRCAAAAPPAAGGPGLRREPPAAPAPTVPNALSRSSSRAEPVFPRSTSEAMSFEAAWYDPKWRRAANQGVEMNLLAFCTVACAAIATRKGFFFLRHTGVVVKFCGAHPGDLL